MLVDCDIVNILVFFLFLKYLNSILECLKNVLYVTWAKNNQFSNENNNLLEG
jgi:hypothetical protein